MRSITPTRLALGLSAVLLPGLLVGPVWGEAKADEVTIPDKTQVKLLDAGDNPRQKLRYRYEPGQKERLAMIMDMAMEMDMGGRSHSQQIPAITMAGLIEITEKTKAGYRQRFKFDNISVADDGPAAPGMRQRMRRMMKSMEGLSGTALMTRRGIVKEANFEAPPNAAPQMRQQLNRTKRMVKNVGTIMPKQPIGEGGRWRVTMPLDNGQFQMKQTATYSLRTLDGDRAIVDVRIEQAAPKQTYKNRGQKIHLNALNTEGTGRITLDMTKQVPESALRMETKVNQSVNNRAVEVTMNADITIRPDDNAAKSDGEAGAQQDG